MKDGFEFSCGDISITHFSGEESVYPVSGDHCHDKYEITCLLSASGRYIVEGCEHKVSNGTLIFITPMSYHKVELYTDKNPEGYTIKFSRDALSNSVLPVLDKLSDGDENHGSFYSADLVSEAIISVFDRLETAVYLEKSDKKIYLEALLSEIIVLLSVAEGQRMVVSEDDLGARVARYLNLNFRKNISLDRLARRFFVSKYYLCRAFKLYSGISVHAYINQKRIIFAKSLIESGMTASRAAEKVGYGDYSAFYRAYVKILGKSPTAE